ncbi:MAG: hypothetical protein QOJ29_116 [Thermoleophilaceae bacterium]|jgi:hypothetical protein|nr:hypothetical protein [Thermoleophilaceae bacterium]
MPRMTSRLQATLVAAAACVAAAGVASASTSTRSRTVNVQIAGGHATKAVDSGRPVVLVAAGLGVPESVFREAFSHVSPAPAGSEPDPAQVNRNKAALLKVLRPYGVTNDALDRASNHYRYNRPAGESWPHTAAIVKATVANGHMTAVRIVRAGSGYTSAPSLRVPGVSDKLKGRLGFSKRFAANGRLVSVSLG